MTIDVKFTILDLFTIGVSSNLARLSVLEKFLVAHIISIELGTVQLFRSHTRYLIHFVFAQEPEIILVTRSLR